MTESDRGVLFFWQDRQMGLLRARETPELYYNEAQPSPFSISGEGTGSHEPLFTDSGYEMEIDPEATLRSDGPDMTFQSTSRRTHDAPCRAVKGKKKVTESYF